MNLALLKPVRSDSLGRSEFVLQGSRRLFLIALFATAVFTPAAFAQSNPASPQKAFYDQVRSFSLGGGSAIVSGLTLNRDRVQMTFTGTFYFATPIDGHVTGAVYR